MKLLFDENLSERLVRRLADLFPGSDHVIPLGLGGAPDRTIWERAATEGFVIVTRDEDFHHLSVLLGPPPKVIWIRLRNAATEDIAKLLRFHFPEVEAFGEHPEVAFLELG